MKFGETGFFCAELKKPCYDIKQIFSASVGEQVKECYVQVGKK
jgi:hypothetical protein